MIVGRVVMAAAAAFLCTTLLASSQARAQFNGYGGNVLGGVIGGVIAGSIIANSGPRVVYRGPRYYVHRPATRRYAAPAPRRYVAAPKGAPPTGSGNAALINASADPFAKAKPAGTIPVSAKP